MTPSTTDRFGSTVGRVQRSSRPSMVQRQSLTTAALDTAWGLAVTKTTGDDPVDATRPIVETKDLAGGTDAKIYADTTSIAKAADKAAALKAAATRSGAVGALMQAWALENWETIRTGTEAYENKKIFNLGRDGEALKIDPWIHKVVVPYTSEDGDKTLTLEFQHTKGFDGYLSKVADSGNADLNKERTGRPRSNSRGAAMYMGKGTKEISASTPKQEANADFSNLHDQGTSNGKKLLEVSGGSGHVAADAYTKLAGEGARFVCVRDNIAKVRNDTYFYCTDEGTIYGITFAKLWVSWAKPFGKGYNISNATIVSELKSNAGLRTELTEVDASKDVRLD